VILFVDYISAYLHSAVSGRFIDARSYFPVGTCFCGAKQDASSSLQLSAGGAVTDLAAAPLSF
jgi:hypothetical protein